MQAGTAAPAGAPHNSKPCSKPCSPPHCRPQALAFARRKKVGAILGVTKERVVLISKKALPDGGVLWSAPVFLRSTSYSLGVTAGGGVGG